jgi:hypothetical protein
MALPERIRERHRLLRRQVDVGDLETLRAKRAEHCVDIGTACGEERRIDLDQDRNGIDARERLVHPAKRQVLSAFDVQLDEERAHVAAREQRVDTRRLDPVSLGVGALDERAADRLRVS